MNGTIEPNAGPVTMPNDRDVDQLHRRIDAMTQKFDACNSDVTKKLNEIHVIVTGVKSTCDSRGKTCAAKVIELDKSVRGNGKEGLTSRVASLEQKGTGKEKFAYLVIGVMGTAAVSILVTLIAHLVSG